MKAGWFQAAFTHEYINQDQIYVGSQKSYVGAIRQHHDEVQTINERNVLQVQAGLSGRIGLNAEIPFVSRQHSHIHHHHGEDLWESWSFSGFGDMVFSAQYTVLVPRDEFDPVVTLIAGVKLPTGITDAKNEEGEEAEVAIQPGSGSTDGIAGVHYRQTLFSVPTITGEYSALPLIAGVSYQFNGKGTYDWRFGNSLLVHVGTAYQFVQRASMLFQINGKFQGFADAGTSGEPRANTGGTWIFASPGLRVDLSDAISAFGYVQLPVYQNVHGIQQTARFNLQFGLSASVGLVE
jgi:hypothetical protein